MSELPDASCSSSLYRFLSGLATHVCQPRPGAQKVAWDGEGGRREGTRQHRDVLERLTAVGGGGGSPPPGPRCHVGKKMKFTKGNVDLGHFWYTNFWVPDPLPPLLSSNTLEPGLHSAGAAIGRGGHPAPHSRTCGRGRGSAQPEIWAGSLLGISHVGWRPRSFRHAAMRWGGAGVRALYICMQMYIDELSPTNPLFPSIALASRT